MSDHTLQFTNELYHYYQRVATREPEILQKLREQTHKLSMGHMQICPEQGQFMRFLVKLLSAKKTMDIGTFTGYSALVVALGLPNDGKVIACDTNTEWTKIAKKYWEMAGQAEKIELRLAPAQETLQDLLAHSEGNSFDFAFIDADKLHYDAYYELTLQLLSPGGVIAIDNVLWDGKVADLEIEDANTLAIRELNEKILQDKRVEMCMLPVGDGLTLVSKL